MHNVKSSMSNQAELYTLGRDELLVNCAAADTIALLGQALNTSRRYDIQSEQIL